MQHGNCTDPFFLPPHQWEVGRMARGSCKEPGNCGLLLVSHVPCQHLRRRFPHRKGMDLGRQCAVSPTVAKDEWRVGHLLLSGQAIDVYLSHL